MALPKLKLVSENKTKRPTILLLSDDMFAHSGIATMSKEFVFGTADRFNWVQVAAGIKHSQTGKIIDVSDQVREATGIQDASVKMYPNDGYGDPNLLRKLIELEKPDVILHFTDPRYWTWLYEMEHELHNRYNIPIAYYAIWDNFPYPFWNAPFYASCDLIMGISKQSHLIHNKVLEYGDVPTLDLSKNENPRAYRRGTVLTKYIPHGIDPAVYRPLTPSDPDWEDYQTFVANQQKVSPAKFIVFWNNRNIRRKNPSDLIYGFKLFTDKLSPEEAKQCMLLMHTDPVDRNGTDLFAVKRALAPDCNIVFSTNRINTRQMNFYYNLASVTVNVASNEGFGLSSAESIMAGTPVINTVTGGLQDQMRFVDTRPGRSTWFTPDETITSNHRRKFEECGEWAWPLWPASFTIQGSVETPYIYDDNVMDTDIAEALYSVWLVHKEQSPSELKRRGLKGREWLMSDECNMTSQNMATHIGDSIELLLDVWKKSEPIRYELLDVPPAKKVTDPGITL